MHLCCPSVYLPGHCNVFSLLPSCDPQHSHGKLLRMDCQPSYSQPLVTKRCLFPHSIQAQHRDTALPPVPLFLPSRSHFPQPCPSPLRKGTQFLHGWHKLSLLDSCNPIATRRCLLLPSSSPVGHALVSVQRHVSKPTTPSHTSRAFLGNRTETGLLPPFRCLKFRHFIWDGH